MKSQNTFIMFRKGRYVVECPNCGCTENSVIDTRLKKGNVVRKRRCEKCNKIFRTYEVPERTGLSISVKKNNKDSWVKYDRDKLTASIMNASYDSNISVKDIYQFVNSLEFSKRQRYSLDEIFEEVCEFLKKKDYKAYVRYAVSRKNFIEETENQEG